MNRYNFAQPKTFSVFRSRDMESKVVGSHKEVVPMGYVNSLEEFDGYVKLEYPKAKKIEIPSHRGSGSYYYSDGDYNIFYHEMNKLNTKEESKAKPTKKIISWKTVFRFISK